MTKNSKTTVKRGATFTESDCPVCGKHYEGIYRTVIKIVALHMKASHPADILLNEIINQPAEDRPAQGMPQKLIR